MSSPLVSIITPTYNHEAFIAQCIESVLAQTYANWEQIIIDDGSTDKTAEIVRRYDDPRIRYFHQENAGIEALAHTYNRALGMAHGSLVAILEGDDFWPIDKLSLMVPAFEDSAVVLAYGEMREADIDGKPAKRMSRTARRRTKLPARILLNNPPPTAAAYMLTADGHSLIPASTATIRRSALDTIGGFQYVPGRRSVDFPTFIQLSTGGTFAYLPKILGYRRMHPRSTTALYSADLLDAAQNDLGHLLGNRSFGLKRSDRRSIETSWRDINSGNEFALGRHCLVNRRWKDSRRHFSRALSVRQARVSLGAVVGWCLSWSHCNMEFLFQWAGRAPLRTS
jgi:glycosyltransferase involved in cell wall biosynthesis